MFVCTIDGNLLVICVPEGRSKEMQPISGTGVKSTGKISFNGIDCVGIMEFTGM